MRPVTATRSLLGIAAALCALLALLVHPPAAQAAGYTKITGSGSTWSSNAVEQWRRNIGANIGLTVNFNANGSSQGREQFKNGTVDFAVSEIPYGLKDGNATDVPPSRGYAYMPIVAGGTAFMYNLRIGGRQVTNLRLSGSVLARIFTGQLTMWNAPEIKADNPGLTLPARRIVPVVRSDGSGTTAQFTTWLAKEHSAVWDDHCRRAGRQVPCGMTSYFPVVPGATAVAKSGSLGVSAHVRQPQGEGAITYVEYSYAVNAHFPVAKILNASGYYVEPTAAGVAVALLRARINEDRSSTDYLTQILDDVYRSTDRRGYPLSSYSYMVVPTTETAPHTTEKGRSLGTFARYFLCEGQQQAEELGYSPLPRNLVQAGFEQVRRIPGAPTGAVDLSDCRNPTFSADGTNTLARNAPMPKDCDKRGATQCADGTGGARGTSTHVNNGGTGGAGTATGGSGSGSSTGGTGGTGSGSGSSTGGGGGTGSATGGTGTGRGTGSGSGSSTGGSGTASGSGSATGGGGTGSGSGHAAGGVATAGTGGAVVDPDTGEVLTGAADGGGTGGGTGTGQDSGGGMIVGTPVTLAADTGAGLRGLLMALSAVLLLATVIAPPLVGRALAARSRRDGGTR
ncbi:phosphate ABC transporter substrate-binding protein PstS [Streptomyces sp. NBC_00094]|uniref:phosphate ABC transporter substrate-binding protein PstS n=1 Tax=Streptomyces sp. NBC_00094 TaxID=2903620 RepID=UPI0022518934|nr:phosphate ABC transporter substrate-binding protein PstS [Streptomyces sp. NBC_00094]MCX5392787.1 phosphate ABC transporter substrate-binding protein PstS [Streptomyces sp. NBC_00094]